MSVYRTWKKLGSVAVRIQRQAAAQPSPSAFSMQEPVPVTTWVLARLGGNETSNFSGTENHPLHLWTLSVHKAWSRIGTRQMFTELGQDHMEKNRRTEDQLYFLTEVCLHVKADSFMSKDEDGERRTLILWMLSGWNGQKKASISGSLPARDVDL